jgi:hypothetical protein
MIAPARASASSRSASNRSRRRECQRDRHRAEQNRPSLRRRRGVNGSPHCAQMIGRASTSAAVRVKTLPNARSIIVPPCVLARLDRASYGLSYGRADDHAQPFDADTRCRRCRADAIDQRMVRRHVGEQEVIAHHEALQSVFKWARPDAAAKERSKTATFG